VRALVMELVEGPTLAARIAEGAIPWKEALPIAEQIAEGLEAAHEKGVVHRDLKPGNVKIKPGGAVKVLDFGLAKVSAMPESPSEDSSTLTMAETEAGRILGTVRYMSPEQASGKPVDKRSDIWAFGVVLWEMLTGKRLFTGETASDTLAGLLAAPIDLDKLPKETPPGIRNLVKRCLERDPRNRLRDIGEARIVLQACLANPSSETESPTPVKNPPHKRLWAMAGAIALLAAIAGWALWPRAVTPAHATRFWVPLPEGATFSQYVSLSPDGRKLLINTTGPQGGFWVRDLEGLEWRRLAGTEGSRSPFWSPDSRFVAFGTGNQLKKIDVSGGPPRTLSTVAGLGVSYGAWNRNGAIVFGNFTGPPAPLHRVSAAGGVATDITAVETSRGESSHVKPSLLPDGEHFLYLILGSPDVQGIYAGSIDAHPGEQSRKRILLTQFAASYADGYLFFMREDTLMAQPFDPRRLELKGEPVAAAEHVDMFRASGIFSASPSALAYRAASRLGGSQLTWFDRQGKASGLFGDPSDNWGLFLSPDGMRAAVRNSDSYSPGDLWTLDFARGTRTRLTFRQSIIRPAVWSSDASRVIFAAGGAAVSAVTETIYEKASSGAGDEVELYKKAGANMVPTSWSRDGRFLLYHITAPTDDVWVLPLEGERKPVQLLGSNFNERAAAFSPDGHWIAYKSDETGRWEIYVRPFVAVGRSGAPSLGEGKWQISKDGAAHLQTDFVAGLPHWRADGKEILFGGLNGAVMSVDVNTSGGAFQAGVPKQLFMLPPNAAAWDVTGDGKKFLAPISSQGSQTPITVVLNWRAELNR
jgi:eukaryotic-like serine/threonine-protein kinase